MKRAAWNHGFHLHKRRQLVILFIGVHTDVRQQSGLAARDKSTPATQPHLWGQKQLHTHAPVREENVRHFHARREVVATFQNRIFGRPCEMLGRDGHSNPPVLQWLLLRDYWLQSLA